MQSERYQKYIWADYIRKRPGMFIGNLRLSGFNQMLEYLLDDILEDSLVYPVVEITFFRENSISILITGVDIKKFLLRIDGLCVQDNRIGSLGIGVFVALSKNISILIKDLSNSQILTGEKGHFEVMPSAANEEESCVVIEYTVDDEIFNDLELIYENVNDFLRQFAFLNPQLKIVSTDKTTEELQRNVFHYPTGVLKQLDFFIAQQMYLFLSLRVNIEAQVDIYSYKIGITGSSIWPGKPFIKTYAGNNELYLGGSLNDGIWDGLRLSIKKIAQKEKTEIVISRKIVEKRFIIIAAVRGDDFNFAGSTKSKLSMPKLKVDVRNLVYNQMMYHFDSNPKAAESVLKMFKI